MSTVNAIIYYSISLGVAIETLYNGWMILISSSSVVSWTVFNKGSLASHNIAAGPLTESMAYVNDGAFKTNKGQHRITNLTCKTQHQN